jgi:hypothetical protein
MTSKLLGIATLFAAGSILVAGTPVLGTRDLDTRAANSHSLRCGRRCGGGYPRCGGGYPRCASFPRCATRSCATRSCATRSCATWPHAGK